MKISASLLAADFSRLKEEIIRFQDQIDHLHIDAMDGWFVPNIAFGPSSVFWVRKATNLPLEVHLYLQQPEKFLLEYLRAGANVILPHFEAVQDISSLARMTREYDAAFGLAINPTTPLTKLLPILDSLDSILILTVNPGFEGQKILPNSAKRITRAKDLREELGLSFEILVDGGINEDTVKTVISAGADTIIMGSAIFKNPNANLLLQSLRKEF
ncbi:MAG: ribulose-phosphate 3-epimerase [Candidatus Hermodarchaeota archaeon]